MRFTTLLALLIGGCGGPKTTTGTPACPELLACPAPVEAECTAPKTAVELADAALCTTATYADDRQPAYDIGETTVTFTGSARHFSGENTASCESLVTIVDTTAPVVQCEANAVLVRSGPDEAWPTPPQGTAQDRCDPDVSISVSPLVLTESLTDVVTTATDASGNQGSCTTNVEVLDIFPVPSFRLLGATLGNGGDTELSLGWEEPEASGVDQVLMQRADSAAGPWTTQSVHDVDDLVATASQASAQWYRLTSVQNGLEGGSTEPIEVRAVSAKTYQLASVSVPTVPFRTTLYGVVRHPIDLDDGPYPLVLIIHGNHGNCRQNGTFNDYCGPITEHECTFSGFSTVPNAEGLAHLAETLAARGMVAVSVSANALNCRGGYIRERAQLLRAHLAQWKAWNDGASSPWGTALAGRLDLSRVGLVGHSRGGDAVSWVPQTLADNPISGVNVASIFAIAPTDFNDATVFDSSWALLLPACDGDVSTLWGSDIYERSTDDVPHKSQVFFPGANHNFFSTEWYFDDGTRACPTRELVGKRPQQTMLQASVGSWLTRTLEGEPPSAVQRAERSHHDAIDLWGGRDLDLRWAYADGDALIIDQFADQNFTNELGGANTLTGFSGAVTCTYRECGSAFLHNTSAISLDWRAGSSAVASFALNNLDTAAFGAVSFRLTSANVSANDGRTEHRPVLTFEDADGREAQVNVDDLVEVPHLYGGYNLREVLQTVRVPFAVIEASNPEINTSSLAKISIAVAEDGRGGSLTFTDLTLEY